MATSNAKKPLAQFSASKDNLVVAYEDSRVKIWQVGARKVAVDWNSHQSITALAWFQKGNQNTKSSKQKGDSSSQVSLVALGTTSGSILIWDAIQGQLLPQWSSNKDNKDNKKVINHTLNVTDLVFNNTGSVLYSCSDDKLIFQWNVQTGTVTSQFKIDTHPIQKLCLNPANTILASATSSIKLWDVSSKRVVKRFTGHSSNVTNLKFDASGRYLFSTSSTERFIYLWDASTTITENTEAKNNTPLQVFTCESIPIDLDINNYLPEQDPIQFHIMAIAESGAINVWNYSPNSTDKKQGSKKPIQPHAKLSLSSRGWYGRFVSQDSLLIVSGESIQPTFETMKYIQNGTIQLESSSNADVKMEDDQNNSQENKSKTTPKKSQVAVRDNTSMPRPTITTVQDMTLEQRLNGNIAAVTRTSASTAPHLPAFPQPPAIATDETKSIAVKATSITGMLVQALHTGDKAMLDSCFAVSDVSIIRNTVLRVPSKYIITFLNEAVHRFHARSHRNTTLVTWIKALLQIHAGYLISQPDLVQVLSTLYMVVDTRLTLFKKMVKLNGRLDLLLSQIKSDDSLSAIDYSEGARLTEPYDDDEDEDDSDEDSDENASQDEDMDQKDEEEDEEGENEAPKRRKNRKQANADDDEEMEEIEQDDEEQDEDQDVGQDVDDGADQDYQVDDDDADSDDE